MSPSRLYSSAERAGSELTDPVITIGNFDGVHIGHQAIFEHTRSAADDAEVDAAAITFTPHPVRYFKPDAEEFRLTTDRRKFELILSCGLDSVVALTFDEALAELSPREFVDQILHRGLGARRVVVGSNFAFGKNRAGTTDDLRRLTDGVGIEADVLDKIECDGEAVSSTRIREALRKSNIRDAARLLGRNYRLPGEIVSGEGRGRNLGFPTANLSPETLVPGDGIYATYLHVDGRDPMPAATSIGTRPTFDDGKRTVESYVLDRDDLSLYGMSVDLEFVGFVRPEEKFSSSEQLVAQMERDVSHVRERLEESPTDVQ